MSKNEGMEGKKRTVGLLKKLADDGIYPAHIRMTDNGPEIQTVQEHCREAAEYASDALRDIGLRATAYLAGAIHDAGKQSDAFRRYLVDIAEDRPVHKGSVNHTFAGVRLVLDHLCQDGISPWAQIAAEHIAYAIGAHHGLFDILDPDGENGFDWRRQKEDPTVAEGVKNTLKQLDMTALTEQLERSGEELRRAYRKLGRRNEQEFHSHLLTRLLLSAVIEGDRRSTAEFTYPGRLNPIPADRTLWQDCLAHLEKRLAEFPTESAVDLGRSRFSRCCKDFAKKPCGIYRLNMPTGAGKTLSSLRYALAHAAHWEKKHIFFVMPLLGIIDQNAAVIRKYLGREDILLEHHSNVLIPTDGPELDPRELLIENWDAPVVITTLVQFLNTLFLHRTTSIRRMHSLCNSVIIFDEVQSVPPRILSLFNQGIYFLSKVCGATVILCSATQPALEYAHRPLPDVPEEIVPYEKTLSAPFRRTRILPCASMDLEAIAAFAAERLAQTDSLLIICNKKAQAATLCSLLQREQASVFHLSAAMCMAHRRSVLAEMEGARTRGKVLCVSTQLMEAGIDVSFGCVIRLQAGMDSVVQAAGRCNRNGKSETPLPVYVIPCQGENLSRLTDIQNGWKATNELFGTPREDYADAAAVAEYYRIYYKNQKGKTQDFYCKELEATLYDLLGQNDCSLRGDCGYYLKQAYLTAGTHFQVFDEDTVDVVVPYGEGIGLIDALHGAREICAEQLELLKPYTISLYSEQKKALEAQGALRVAASGILTLEANWYNSTLGLQTQREMTFLEV